jgi:glycosyltransferase involved in cell wall biosynthesis
MASLRHGERTLIAEPSARRSDPDTADAPLQVVVLSQYFYPEVAGVAQRLTELSVELVRRDVAVRAIVAQPSYRGRQKLPRRERHCGVDIERLPLPYFDRKTLFRRAVSGVLFVLLVTARLTCSRIRGPLLIGTTPPFLHLAGWFLKRIRGLQYVCLVQDIYPDLAVRLGYLRDGSRLVKMWRRVNQRVYRDADAIVTLGARMAATIRATLPAWPSSPRVDVIPNWEDPEIVTSKNRSANWFRQRHGLVDKLVIMYAGNMGLVNDIETLLAAARHLRDRQDVVFLFVGGGAKEGLVLQAVEKDQLANVRLLPYQEREVLSYSLTCAEIGAVTLARGAEGLCVPGKLYTALAAGQAILAIAARASEIADVVEEYRCGVCLSPGDAHGVVDAILDWQGHPDVLRTMQRNARRCFEERFTKPEAAERHYQVLREVAGRRPRH